MKHLATWVNYKELASQASQCQLVGENKSLEVEVKVSKAASWAAEAAAAAAEIRGIVISRAA